MLAEGEGGPPREPSQGQVIGYIQELTTELADLAAKHGQASLAASLSIVAVQAAGERRLLGVGGAPT